MLRLLGLPEAKPESGRGCSAAGPVDHPSDHEEKEADAEQHGGLLVDARQPDRPDDVSTSARHPP